MERSKCIVCCLSLPRTAKRRILSSPATKHVIPILNEFIERNYPGVSERLVADGLLLCMPCFRALEAILKIYYYNRSPFIKHAMHQKQKEGDSIIDISRCPLEDSRTRPVPARRLSQLSLAASGDCYNQELRWLFVRLKLYRYPKKKPSLTILM